MKIDLFTEEEVRRAKKIIAEAKEATPHNRLRDEVVTEEVMQRIDQETGQQNDRNYMAYRLEYIAGQTK